MSTSLAEQLKKLRAPQTSLLLQDKKRPSLLFDPKEAANLDRDTVYNIGKNGFDDLVRLSDSFREFESTLFARSSISLQRSIHNSKVNKKLDNEIERFLIFLSPYFLLNTAHKALEWLIFRFQIHQFNKDAFLMLILPYHETRIFVRALQLIDLSDQADKWHWLEPLQKPGVPLSSLTLVNRVATDNGFLKLLCTHIVKATSIHGEDSSSLSTLIAFYTMVIIGAIERAQKITEVQVGHLLPALAKGLASSTIDYAAGNYMILAKLSSKTQLTKETIEYLLLKALKRPTLSNDVMLLILYIYESTPNSFETVSNKIVRRIFKLSWFCDEITKIKTDTSVNVMKFLYLFLESALKYVLKNPDEYEEEKKVIKTIFEKVPLEEKEVSEILNNTLNPSIVSGKLSKIGRNFLSQIYGFIEVRYATCFDKFLKDLMKNSESNDKSKEQFKFLMTYYSRAKSTKESLDAWDRLNHYLPEQRMIAIDILSKNLKLTENFDEMITKSLLNRFDDEDVRVVDSLLKFPVDKLKKLFPTDILVDHVMTLLSQCHTEKKKVLAKPALKLLLQVCHEDDDTSIFVATLPYLFPSNEEEIEIAMEVLNSQFAKKNKYLQAVKNDLNDILDAESIGSAAFHNILNWELLPKTENILTTMKLSPLTDATTLFFNLVLLGSVCRVPVGSLHSKIAREVIDMAAKMIKQYPRVKSLSMSNQLNGEQIQDALSLTSQGILPLQAGTYVLEMVHRRLDLQSNPLLDFEDDLDYAQLVLRLLEIFFEGLGSSKRHTHYSWCLKIFFQRHFPSSRDMLRFLSQFFIKPVQVQTSLHALKIVLIILNKCDSLQWISNDQMFISNLLIALARPNKLCREAAGEVLNTISKTLKSKMDGPSTLLAELSSRSMEIFMDSDQISLILYTLLSPDPDVVSQIKKDLRKKYQEAREFLFNIVTDSKTPVHISAQLLEVLTHVNGTEIVKKLAPQGHKLLQKIQQQQENKTFAKMNLKNILQRFDSVIVDILNDDEVWKFFEAAISNHQLQIPTEKGIQTPSIILVKQIDEMFFENCGKKSSDLQKKILTKLVDIVTDCEIGSIVTVANRTVRRVKIDAQLVINELKTMKNAKIPEEKIKMNTAKARRLSKLKEATMSSEIVHTKAWKRGITILEFIQRAENIVHEKLLIPALFDLLRMCLGCEEPSPLEYTNQLLLSTIHRLVSENIYIPDADQQVDLVSQCIRQSQNPQTHHHALLVLVELFKVANLQIALHNIMPIFTFIGGSVLRQDDAYSVQIITKTIETIIPIINVVDNEVHACTVLRIFIVSLPDIPEHRRIPLFVKLLQLFERHLYLFYLLTFESHVLIHGNDSVSQQMSSQRLEFALSISQEFSPKTLIDVCIKLLHFVQSLPVELDENADVRPIFKKNYIFNVEKNTPKQLRHYKYTVVQFLSALLSSLNFVNRVALLSSEESAEINPSYDEFIVLLIVIIQSTSKSADIHQGKPKGLYWKVLLHHLYEILDAIDGLLPNNSFIITVNKLINHDLLSVRKKVLELTNLRLQKKKFNVDDHKDLLKLIDPLIKIIKKQGMILSQEMDVIQQTALITLKLLAKYLAPDYPDKFKSILEITTEFMKVKEGPLLGSVVLCVGELCGSMRTYAISHLNKFMPEIIRLLKKYCNQEVPDIVVLSIVSALQKIVESLGNFLSLYLDKLLSELCRLSSLYTDSDNPKIESVVVRIKATRQKLSNCIPLRVLLPAVSKTYHNLVEKKAYQCIPALMEILAEAFTNIVSSDLRPAMSDLATFFLKVLEFREHLETSEALNNCEEMMETDDEIIDNRHHIVCVEESVSKALVMLILKLSEATFTPLYFKLYDWAATNPDKKLRNITFYKLSKNIAEALKSLFTLFAGHFLQHAAMLLSQNNLFVNKEPTENLITDESQRVELIEAILTTLYNIFNYDIQNFVNQERFETIAKPIVDQIENIIGEREEFSKRAKDIIVPCIASFVSATQDDSLHKQVVYQTLLKTRHSKPHVRSTALSVIVEIARKLGEDFMPLLPETIPFLAELLEDEDEEIERATQNAVRTLEEILGEPLQKYF
ncbi:HEAT repeat-containing protein 1 [Chelonus insularis]|uniref:HEAT repeat-containing protein 1 n=1 Tax=Chelonus insularis TaxID=460826 RepID=UPI00158D70B5|nr:HEAT repeat-containing protein 1 [Chelonus insularis]